MRPSVLLTQNHCPTSDKLAFALQISSQLGKIFLIQSRDTTINSKKATEIKNRLDSKVRVKMDISDKMPGWKFSE